MLSFVSNFGQFSTSVSVVGGSAVIGELKMVSDPGGTPLYKPCGYVLCRFGLKTGIHFPHFSLESGMFFVGTTDCMNMVILSIQNE